MSNQTETSYQKNIRANVRLEHLYLDPNNYRFIDNDKYVNVAASDAVDDKVQRRTRNFILGKNNEDIDDLVRSLKKNGYLDVDQIQVKKLEGDIYIVIEGNRRTTALKLLQEEYEKGNDIGQLDPLIFSQLPVIVSEGLDQSHYKILMGLKHISGNKKWPAVNQAELLKSLRKDGLSEQEIKDALGISTVQLRRYLRALALVDAYKDSDYGDQFRTEMFNLFSEAIKQPKIMKWIEWDDFSYHAKNKENLNRLFFWISKDESEDDEGLIIEKEPILSKGTDFREIADFIEDEKALSVMEKTRSINDVKLVSDRFSSNKFDNIIDILNKQLLDAIAFSRFASQESQEKLPDLKRKFDALLVASKGQNNVLLSPTYFGEIARVGRGQREVLVNVPNKGYSEVFISNYKAIKGIKISNLKQINVFAGTNNAGKSTLLEAIYALTIQNDVDNYADLLRRRGKFSNEMSSLWLDRQFTGGEVSGTFFNTEVRTHIFRDKEEEDFNTNYLSTIRIESGFDTDRYEGRLRLFEDKISESIARPIVNICRIRYSTPFAIHNQDDLITAYEQSVQSKSKDKILDFLMSQVDNGIIDIDQVEISGIQRFLVTHENLMEAIDLSSFGDGVQRIFHIALQFAACKNGVLLIDEIENAIHHSLFKLFVQLIQDFSKIFQVQVFITSHSKECIDSFFVENLNNDHISAYRLERDIQGAIECFYEEGNRYSRLIKNFDADLRG